MAITLRQSGVLIMGENLPCPTHSAMTITIPMTSQEKETYVCRLRDLIHTAYSNMTMNNGKEFKFGIIFVFNHSAFECKHYLTK